MTTDALTSNLFAEETLSATVRPHLVQTLFSAVCKKSKLFHLVGFLFR